MSVDALGRELHVGDKVTYVGQTFGSATINFGEVLEIEGGIICVYRSLRQVHALDRSDTKKRRVWVETWKIVRLDEQAVFPWEEQEAA